MKKISLTAYITIWYAVFLVAVVAILICIITYTGNENSNNMARDRIQEQITQLSDEIRVSGEDFVLNDEIRYFVKGVYLSVYNGDGELLEGEKPIQLGNFPKLKDRKLYKEADSAGSYWYIYDNDFVINDEAIWIRGIAIDQTNTVNNKNNFSTLRWLLIGMVIIAILGGHMIARTAMNPIRKLIRTAEEIRDDGNLTRRIDAGRRNDEIGRLAESFNGMFDSLEKNINKEKQFTSDVSHELRTPLSVIISSSEFAMEDESYRSDSLQLINEEARRMSGLVNRLLTLSRSDEGRLALNYDEVNLSELCISIIDQQRFMAEEKNIRITTDIAPGITAQCDESFMIRALLNLIDNAMTYGINSRGEQTLINVDLHKVDEEVRIKVSDNGPGISEEHIDKIWDRFYRVDKSRNERGSSGLGLSMVEVIVTSHGGSVSVESEPGAGTAFTISIPLNREVQS